MDGATSPDLDALMKEISSDASAAPGGPPAADVDGTTEALNRLLLERVCSSARDEWQADQLESMGKELRLSIIVLGASGDLAKKKTYPALYELFRKGFLPRRLQVVGYARSKMTSQELRDRLRPHLKGGAPKGHGGGGGGGDGEAAEQFLNACSYMAGDYDASEGFERLGAALTAWEAQTCMGMASLVAAAGAGAGPGPGERAASAGPHGAASPAPAGPRLGRLFYLALPPSVYPQVCANLRRHCAVLYGMSRGAAAGGAAAAAAAAGLRGPGAEPGGRRNGGGGGGAAAFAMPPHGSFVRLILEKPFGHDLASSEALAEDIGSHWPEEQLYRIDHYLGKELVQNMLMLRFANPIFGAFFNRHYISNIQVTFKEPFGTEGRGGYFDQYGIIRDVIQNHLIQVLALLGMEAPVSLHPDDIRDEKVKLLRCIAPPGPGDAVLGQYVADKGQPGYRDDPTVPPGSNAPTFAAVRLFVRNERWDGVPIVVKAGKALNERLAAVRIQLRTPAASIFGSLEHMRNELVIRFQPGEAIYAKMVVKKPGLEMDYEMSELDLSYPERYSHVDIPDAYERLILDCMRGDQQHFVRRDELRAAWAIFTPLLHAIDAGALQPHPYPYGSRGPAAVDAFIADSGYVRTEYSWQHQHTRSATPPGQQAGQAAQQQQGQHPAQGKL